MRKLIQKIFRRPVVWMANRFSSSPRQKDVNESLNWLIEKIREGKTEHGVVLPFDLNSSRFIILSDQHKGTKDLADDFRLAEKNYMTALRYYYENDYTFINLGDSEELWESTPGKIIEKNRLSLLEEARFLQSDRYYRIFGNHDLEWKYSIQQTLYLRPIFGEKFTVYEGLLLTTQYNGQEYSIFLTHGHQGDQRSDGNAFSTWFVAAIWTPIQRFLQISLDTVSDSFELVDRHNIMMYQWSATHKNLVFISGHTHKPVFASMDHIDRLGKELEVATAAGNEKKILYLQKELERRKKEYSGKTIVQTMAIPSYFNTGCCCFSDGDISGIEICNGEISLVKWEQKDLNSAPQRRILEKAALEYIFNELAK